MIIAGYTDRLSAAPGESINFMVSCQEATYHADIVRLIHGDTSREGPGFKETLVDSHVSGEYDGHSLPILRGSYIIVADHPLLRPQRDFSLQVWLYPTDPQKGEQTLLSKGAPDGYGSYGLIIDSDGCLTFWLADRAGRLERHRTGAVLRAHEWYFAAVVFDAVSGIVRIVQEPISRWPQDPSRARVAYKTNIAAIRQNTTPFLMAAHLGKQPGRTRDHYDGKLDSPRLFLSALTDEQIEALLADTVAGDLGAALVADWDFACDFSSALVTDVSGNTLHGQTINLPSRAVTGHNWTGEETDFKLVPEQYRAIHFHADDLENAGWPVAFTLTIPKKMRSGVYAARLRANDGEDYVPFFVRPSPSASPAPVLFLVPTLSYLAYGNYHLEATLEGKADLEKLAGRALSFEYPTKPSDRFMVEHDLLSLYEKHADQSGVYYVSYLCPQMVMRPKYRHPALGLGLGAPHQLGADLHLLDWMEAKGCDFDVATDHNLHAEGANLLHRYRVIVTGTHPEYWTGPMLDSLESYLAGGGRLMYLGGNGFYWVTSLDPERPHVVEVRRWGGSQSWRVRPGEEYHSTTGERGGLWRNRGRTPQEMTGVGFTAQGFDVSLPYHRLPDSFDARASFIFEGIGEEEIIGGFGLVMGGAGGYEIDRADVLLGTPPHALMLATATGFSDVYQHVVEEVDAMNRVQGGSVNPQVRADMVFFEGPHGGAVFSVGSIAWCASLSHNNYENNVSRITLNVLTRFASEKGLP